MDFIEMIKAVILGIIQGITEWLPISSTGHLILFDNLWPMTSTPEFFEVFKVVIQFGSILAVLVLFFHKLNPFSPKKSVSEKQETFTLWKKVAVGCIPIVAAGLPLDMVLEDYLSSVYIIAATLILYGIAFLVIESRKKQPKMKSLEALTYRTAFFIGCFQVLAAIPGTSRSGATILGAVILGCSRYVASEFSFFLAIPVMAGASGLKLLKYFLKTGMFSRSEWILLLIGTLVSFVVSVFAIRMLLSYIRKHDFKIFGIYRIILGIIVIIYFSLLA
ncbi:undecaprenyl-diphosphate phosphatase [Blautia pseudococcoides]|uniref:undecaprenyl-diphosphate phosphatase n=1 Tax=Blautia pseudococcoides TaxID=1796616 RepID=UPI00148AFD75|nr:undecaprenyl-diphosphate phosphatase [Blautia pseudococcoides]QJU15116.1 undecaprenyl-diphosphate phosphatase [Blautia pseudococcoides]